jgi:dienelactone hydrolase
MFRDVVLQDTRPDEWPGIRERIYARIMDCMGTAPDIAVEPDYEVVEEYEKFGLRHRKIRYRIFPDQYIPAVVVLPDGVDEAHPAPAVVACHGTDAINGKYNVLSLDERPRRAYGIELAQRGFVTAAADNYEFGERLTKGEDLPHDEIINRYNAAQARFHDIYPEWSLDGLRLWEWQRLLDALATMPLVRAEGGFGVIGNSLGGRSAIFLAAFDERIAAAVPSTGVSPNLTNVYRTPSGRGAPGSSRGWIDRTRGAAGKMLYDYQDMIALCAPRPLMLLEPYNDAYNPYPAANFECYVKGQRAYALLGKPECFVTLIHGDGHDTVDDVRDFAYRWFERWLKV